MQFGSYTTVRELAAGPTATVYLATDDPARSKGQPRFAIKVFTTSSLPDWQTEETANAVAEKAAEFLRSTTRQKSAHTGGARHVAAIRDGGQSEAGAWFATDYYPRTAQKLIEGRVSLNRETIHHIIASAVRGALEFKALTGEPHGNIKPANVLIGGASNLLRAPVVLIDPSPGAKESGDALELSDLRAVGELIFRLVRRRDMSGADQWPVEMNLEWKAMFEETAQQWLTLCNWLLDPNLSLGALNLDGLQSELGRLKPKDRSAWLKIAAAVVACVGAGIGVWLIIASLSNPERKFQSALNAAQEALDKRDYVAADAKAQAALALKPGEPSATKIREEVERQLALMREAEQEYQTALNEAQQALDKKDYAVAEAKAKDALGLKPGDAAATKIQETVQQQLGAVEQAERRYQTALAAAQQALDRKDYTLADTKVKEALGVKPGDVAATQIQQEAQRQLALMREAEQKYQTALTEAQQALDKKDYAVAEVKAKDALGLKPGDAAATKIQQEVQRQLGAMAEAKSRYETALAAAQQALGRKDYVLAESKAKEALAVRPGDAAATRIQQEAQGQVALMQEGERKYQTALTAAQQALEKKDYVLAETKVKEALGVKPGDLAATRIQQEVQRQVALMRETEQKYQTALNAAQQALDKKDYAVAEAKVREALGVRPGDVAATKIQEEVQRQLSAMAEAKSRYETALAGAQQALDKKDYALAEAKAKEALGVRPGDAVATRIQQEAQRQVALMRETEQKYQTALSAAQQALDKKDYVLSETKAKEALSVKPGDAAATRIQQEVQRQVALMRETEQKYQTALNAAQQALDKKDYVLAETKVKEALGVKPGDAAATRLQQEMQRQVALMRETEQKYQTAVNAAEAALVGNNYSEALAKATQILALKPGDAKGTQFQRNAKLGLSQQAFAEGEYEAAGRICNEQKGDEAFERLARQNRDEQEALNQYRILFNEGDYSFIGRVKDNSYAAKKPFRDLIDVANTEQTLLGRLAALRETNDWRGVNDTFAAIPPDTKRKRKFIEVATWLNENNPATKLKRRFDELDLKLAGYAKLLSPDLIKKLDKTPVEIPGRKLDIDECDTAKLLRTQIAGLGDEYRQWQSLAQSYPNAATLVGERAKLIKKLDETARDWCK